MMSTIFFRLTVTYYLNSICALTLFKLKKMILIITIKKRRREGNYQRYVVIHESAKSGCHSKTIDIDSVGICCFIFFLFN